MRRRLGARSENDPRTPGDSEDATSRRAQIEAQGAPVAQTGTPKKRENRGRYRQRALKRPGTSSTSPKQIEMAKRRAEALDLRVQSYSYEEIAEHLGVTKSTIERDIQRALKELVIEPAHAVFTLEMRRVDALIGTYMPDALKGDSDAASVVHRYMVHRANLLGWGKPDMAAKLTINDGTGGEPRRLKLEFVLPGQRVLDMERLDQLPPHREHHHQPVQYRVEPAQQSRSRVIDAAVNPPTSVPIVQPKKPFDWMK
jgi:predicted DNA-binding protein (UPF0251 family)